MLAALLLFTVFLIEEDICKRRFPDGVYKPLGGCFYMRDGELVSEKQERYDRLGKSRRSATNIASN